MSILRRATPFLVAAATGMFARVPVLGLLQLATCQVSHRESTSLGL